MGSNVAEQEVFGPRWFAQVSRDIEVGHAREACEDIGDAIRRALDDAGGTRPSRWSITELWLQLLEQNEIAYAEWVRDREGELYGAPFPKTADGDRGELARELAAVADRLPTLVLAALARSVREGTPEHAETVIIRHAIHHAHSARLLGELLASDAPRLFAQYELALQGLGAGVGAAPKLKHIGGVAVPHLYSRRERTAILMGLVGLVALPAIFLSSGRRLGASASGDSGASSRTAQPAWLGELCKSADEKALCAAGTRIYIAKDCQEAFAAFNDLELAAKEHLGSLDYPVQNIVRSLHEEVQVECMRVPGAR